ncbi:hypothetical protein [Micromonospora sp. NPDC093277]|uniref:hypothetical protein n=1 Tax=Micromonospora sp. NPDC093277 TaxID=3364291 RepID=UPI00382F457E
MDTEDRRPVECNCSTTTPPPAGGTRQRTVRVALLILQGMAYASATANSAIDIVSKLT